MPVWLIWLIAAGALAAAETTTLTLVLAMFAGGALAGSITAAVGGPVLLQWIVALLATTVLLAGVRPVARRHLVSGGGVVTGSDALVGQEAVVLSPVDAQDGRIRLNGGEWVGPGLRRESDHPHRYGRSGHANQRRDSRRPARGDLFRRQVIAGGDGVRA